MTAQQSGAQPAIKTTRAQSNMKMLRTVAGYAALAVGVSVGGIAVGAIIIAPAVSRATPFFSKNASQSSETNGSIGQADGDGALASSAAPFKPMVESIATASSVEASKLAAPASRSGLAKFKRKAGYFFEDAQDFVRQIPKITWVLVDVGLVALFAAVWFYRRRNTTSTPDSVALNTDLPRRTAASLPSKLVPGKGNRTPKAVAALAEAGTAPADIARRTGLPLDAVAMLLSLGSLGARQLQPPTA